ncbi:MAG: hypothetical protein QNL04_10840 [SAR324 cluster bacterium]|nr:hypothetical protein [SAR324 cluster bacterium]
MTFTVKYKLQGQWFWQSLKDVEGDSVVPENGNRLILLADKTRIELPKETAIIFPPARFVMIRDKVKAGAGA